MKLSRLNVGERVTFAEEKQCYTVRAASSRFAICTKPFNCQGTVIYTIVDFKRDVRGCDNMIFCAGYETQEQIDQNLKRLDAGEMSVSHRHGRHIPLHIVEVRRAK